MSKPGPESFGTNFPLNSDQSLTPETPQTPNRLPPVTKHWPTVEELKEAAAEQENPLDTLRRLRQELYPIRARKPGRRMRGLVLF